MMDLNLDWQIDFCSKQCFYAYEFRNKKNVIPRLDILSAESFLPSIDSILSYSQILPHSVCQTLLLVAVKKRDLCALSVLLRAWPHRVFRLNNLSGDEDPTQLSIGSQFNRNVTPFEREQSFMISLSVIHAFLNILRDGCVSKIKILDLRGFPLTSVGVDYLTCQGLLSYVESERNKILQAVDSAVTLRKISEEDAVPFGDLHDLQFSLGHETNCVIIIDCFIGLQGTEFRNLCKWLTVSNFESSPLKVLIDKLYLSDGLDVAVNLLLKLTKRRPLTGIGIARMEKSDLAEILPQLSDYANSLECLDFSNISVNFQDEFGLLTTLAEFLGKMVNLRRLDLACCSLKRILKKLLSHIPNGLTYLNLNRTDLNEMDLIYLSTSFHCRTLKELILSNNDFGSSTSSLCCLLKECRNSLKYLNLSNCSLHSSQADRIFTNLSSVICLEYLNIGDNVLDRNVLTIVAPNALKNLTNLQSVIFPYPAFDFSSPTPNNLNSDENAEALLAWTNEFNTLISDLFSVYNVFVKCSGIRRELYANL